MSRMIGFFRKNYYIFLIIAGGLLVADTLVLLYITSSRNLGIFMPIVIGIPLLTVGVFHTPLSKFFSVCIFGKIIKWGLISCYALFFLLFSVTTAITVSHGFSVPDNEADVLIILGCGVRGERVTLTLSRRLDKAIEYLDANEDTLVIVSGGQGEGEAITEALAMKRYLVAHGIDENRIIQEDNSHSTEENFAYSKEIIDEMFPDGAKTVYVTTRFHVFRAGLVAKKCGIQAQGMGASGVWYITLNDYLRECAAITVYAITGKV